MSPSLFLHTRKERKGERKKLVCQSLQEKTQTHESHTGLTLPNKYNIRGCWDRPNPPARLVSLEVVEWRVPMRAVLVETRMDFVVVVVAVVVAAGGGVGEA